MDLLELVPRCHLASVDLLSHVLERNIPAGGADAVLPEEMELDLEANVTTPTTAMTTRMWFLCNLTVWWVAPGQKRENALAATKVQYRIVYDVGAAQDPIPKDVANAFADQVALHHAWPFLRQRVHAAAMDLGLPPALLPLRHQQLVRTTPTRKTASNA